MSGKVCYDELDRIKRVVRKDAMKYPVFMKNMNAYLKTLINDIWASGANYVM